MTISMKLGGKVRNVHLEEDGSNLRPVSGKSTKNSRVRARTYVDSKTVSGYLSLTPKKNWRFEPIGGNASLLKS